MKVSFNTFALLLVGARPMGTMADSHSGHDANRIALATALPLKQVLVVNTEGKEARNANQRPPVGLDWSSMVPKAKLPALLVGVFILASSMVVFLRDFKREVRKHFS